MTSIVSCLDALKSGVQSIADFKDNRTMIALNPDELVQAIKGLSVPCVGIVYEGLQAIAEGGNTNRGLGAQATFGLYLAVDAAVMTNALNKKNTAIDHLSDIFGVFHDKKSPSGQYWQFMSERYVASYPGRTLWMQKWGTKVMDRT